MSVILSPPPKIYIPPESPHFTDSKRRPGSRNLSSLSQRISKSQSPDSSFRYTSTSGQNSPVKHGKRSPYPRAFTPTFSRTPEVEENIVRKEIFTEKRYTEQTVPVLPKSPSFFTTYDEKKTLSEKSKIAEGYSEKKDKSSPKTVPNKPKVTELKYPIFDDQRSKSADQRSKPPDQRPTSADPASLDGTSWASGFLSKPSYADILSGRISPVPTRSPSPVSETCPDDRVLTSSYQKEVVHTDVGEDTTEKIEASAFKSSSYTVPSSEPIVEMPESPEISRKKLEIKLPKSPFAGHFVRGASPKFFDLKTGTQSPTPAGLKEFSESRVSSTSVSRTVVFSEGEQHIEQTESSHSQIETKSFCASPQESRKLTYAQVARISSPAPDGCRSVSPRRPPSTNLNSQASSKNHSNNQPQKPPDSSPNASNSDTKSFLEVDPDNRNRPKGGGAKNNDGFEHFLSKTSEQDQKNLNRPLLSRGEDALAAHLLSRGTNFHHPLSCEIFRVSQEMEGKRQSEFLCIFGIADVKRKGLLRDVMSLFSSAQSPCECVSVCGQILLTPVTCAHIKQRYSQTLPGEVNMVCLDCGSLSINYLSSACETLLNSNYWEGVASYICKVYTSNQFMFLPSDALNCASNVSYEPSKNDSIANFETFYLESISSDNHLLTQLFLPSNYSQRKLRWKMRYQTLNHNAVVISDNVNYVLVPFNIVPNFFKSNDVSVETVSVGNIKELPIKEVTIPHCISNLVVEEENFQNHMKKTLNHQELCLQSKVSNYSYLPAIVLHCFGLCLMQDFLNSNITDFYFIRGSN